MHKSRLISVVKFTELYGFSKETQKIFRNRVNHPIPYLQVVRGGMIQYWVHKVEKWLENYEVNI